jgi:glycosyltransferase involved in cell wall biosynthesis
MKKPILLTWHDFIAPTGFSNVAHQLLQGVSETFETHIVGINHRTSIVDWQGCRVYPTGLPDDSLGMKFLIHKAHELQPDVIFLFQDYYNINDCIREVKEAAPNAKICVYFPIDGTPVLRMWDDVMFLPDFRFSYSHWASRVMRDAYPEVLSEVLYHGVDTKVFKPISNELWIEERLRMGWENKFIGVCVNRFQPRKQISTLLRVWSMFSEGAKVCKMCKHKQPKHVTLCELCQSGGLILSNYLKPKEDVGLYLHMNMVEPNAMGGGLGNSLLAAINAAGFRGGSYKVYTNLDDIYAGDRIPESQINIYYNLADVNLSTAVGEGAGLSLIESQAAGIPSIAPLNSAIPEMIGSTGTLVPNAAIFSMSQDISHARPIVNEFEMVKALEKNYSKWQRSGKARTSRKDCVDNVHKNFLWNDKREALQNILYRLSL